MNNFESYILVIKSSNQKLFDAEKIQLTPASLEAQLKKAFWAGFRHCEELSNTKENNSSQDFGDIFGDIFGSLFGKK